ncbi:MAG: mechanosensitive ion channel family protein [Proteobacteria bacterium]|nr:mechanosensitive ion channel family protein [Pseudomonadota bacterium]
MQRSDPGRAGVIPSDMDQADTTRILVYLIVLGAAFLATLIVAMRPVEAQTRRLARAAAVFLALSWLLVARTEAARLLTSSALVTIVNDQQPVLATLWWLAFAWTVKLGLDRFVWRNLQARGMPVPKLLTDVVHAIVFTVAIFGILSFVFDQPVAGLLATSGIVAIVVGLALQSTLSDVFSGIALNIERPYRAGDWIQLDKDTVGEVVEINWRATRLRTRLGNELIMPNSIVAKAQIINYHYPIKHYRASVTVGLNYSLPPARAKSVLRAAALRAPLVLTDPSPWVRIKEFADTSIVYEIMYWVDGYAADLDAHDQVATNMWYALDAAGIEVPFPRKDVYLFREPAARPDPGPRDLISRIDLFEALSIAECEMLAAGMERIEVPAGTAVVTQGESGESLYVVAEGVLYVGINFEGRGRHIVARLGPGELFGEMSLLTGEPRSATVVTETAAVLYGVAKPVMAEILGRNPGTAERLGRVLAERKLATQDFARALPMRERNEMVWSQGQAIVQRIFAFFGIKAKN